MKFKVGDLVIEKSYPLLVREITKVRNHAYLDSTVEYFGKVIHKFEESYIYSPDIFLPFFFGEGELRHIKEEEIIQMLNEDLKRNLIDDFAKSI